MDLEIVEKMENFVGDRPVSSITENIETLIAFSEKHADEIIRKAVQGNFDVNFAYEGYSLLHMAVFSKKLQLLDLLLKRPKILLNVVFQGCTPLCLGIKSRCPKKLILKLIKAGADVTIPDYELKTPLHYAAMNNSIRIAKKLIEHGADINARDINECTPLYAAITKTCNSSTNSRTCNYEMIHMLLYYGTDVNTVCFDGDTPFMAAIRRNHKIAMQLIEYVDDINYINDSLKCTPLLLAVEYNNKIAIEIIRRGGDVNYVNEHGWCALHEAIEKDDSSLFKELFPLTDKDLLLQDDMFLYTYLSDQCTFKTDEWLDCLYNILDCEIAVDLVGLYVTAQTEPYWMIMEECANRNVPAEERLKLIYLFLSWSLSVTLLDLFLTYARFGFKEELEALLYADIHYGDSICSDFMECLFPFFLILLDRDVDDIMLVCLDQYDPILSYFEEISAIIRYCTPNAKFKEKYSNKIQKHQQNNIVSQFANILSKNRVPLLLEFSRNAVRRLLLNNLKVKSTCHYYTAINCLNLPEKVKDILRFKIPLYHEDKG